MFKKTLMGIAAGAMALGAAVGIAGPAQAYTPGTLVSWHSDRGGLGGSIGYQAKDGTSGQLYVGGAYVSKNYLDGKVVRYIRAGGGYCVWEELFYKETVPIGSGGTQDQLKKYNDYNWGKNPNTGIGYAANTLFQTGGYTRINQATNLEWQSQFHVYSC